MLYYINDQKVTKNEYNNYLSWNFLHCRTIYHRKENKLWNKYIYKYELVTNDNDKYTKIEKLENEYRKTHEKEQNTLYTFTY